MTSRATYVLLNYLDAHLAGVDSQPEAAFYNSLMADAEVPVEIITSERGAARVLGISEEGLCMAYVWPFIDEENDEVLSPDSSFQVVVPASDLGKMTKLHPHLPLVAEEDE